MSVSSYASPSSSYTKELLHLGGASVAAGVTTLFLTAMAPLYAAPLALLGFASIVGLAANFRDRKDATTAVLRLMLGIGAGGFMAVTYEAGWPAWLAGGFLLGASWDLEWHKKVGPRVGLWVGYAAAFAAAVFTTTTLMGALGVRVPSLVSALFQTSIWGVFLMLPAWVKHQQDSDDTVLRDFDEAMNKVDRAQRELLDSAKRSYRRVKQEISREDDPKTQERSLKIAQDVSGGIIAFSKRAHELRDALSLTQERPLEGRARELEGRIRQTRDVGLKRELMASLQEVIEQLRVRRNLETACTRIEARQQRYMTALDRLHVTLVQNDTMTTEGGEGELLASLDSLEHLSESTRWASLSVEELCSVDLEPEVGDDVEDALDPESQIQLQAMLSQLDELTHRPGASASVLPKPHLPAVETSEQLSGSDGYVIVPESPTSPQESQEEEVAAVSQEAEHGASPYSR